MGKCIDLYGQDFFDNTLAGKAKAAIKHQTRSKKPKERQKQIKGGNEDEEAPPKKKRTPSEYNLFMKEVIARIKGENPDMPHIEAFTLAAKLWKEKSAKEKEAKAADTAQAEEPKKEEAKDETKNESKNENLTVEVPTGEAAVGGESTV